MGKVLGSCKGKGGPMHRADVNKGMLGANGIDMLAVPIGQVAAVSTGYGTVTIAGQSQKNTGDVMADIDGSATTDAVTGTISSAIASLAKTWSGKNVTIGQAGVGKQVTDSVVKIASSMQVFSNLAPTDQTAV